MLCCNCFRKSAPIFTGRKYGPNKQSPKYLIHKMIFLTHTHTKTNVFKFRIAEIRFSLELKYPPVFITNILFLVSVMLLEVSERGIFLNPSVQKEAIWMHLDRHPEMPRASVDPEGVSLCLLH